MWQMWVSLILGIYVAISPWVLGFSDQSTLLWSSVIAGFIVAASSVWALAEHRRLATHATKPPGAKI